MSFSPSQIVLGVDHQFSLGYIIDLQSKSIMISRVMVSKRKDEFNITDEDIRSLSKDDLIDNLNM